MTLPWPARCAASHPHPALSPIRPGATLIDAAGPYFASLGTYPAPEDMHVVGARQAES